MRFNPLYELTKAIVQIPALLANLNQQLKHQGDMIMAAIDDLKQAVTDVYASVAKVATAISAAQAGTGGVSAADAQGVVAQLKQTKVTLDAALATQPPPPAV